MQPGVLLRANVTPLKRYTGHCAARPYAAVTCSTHSTLGSLREPCTVKVRPTPGRPWKVPLSLRESPNTFTAVMPKGLSPLLSSPPPQAVSVTATATARALSFQLQRGSFTGMCVSFF